MLGWGAQPRLGTSHPRRCSVRTRTTLGAFVGAIAFGLLAIGPVAAQASLEPTSATPAFCYANGPVPAGYALVMGGAGADFLVGGAGPDLIRGLGGNDVLIGNDGNDLLCGGPGNDYLFGRNGIDRLWGGDGDDRLFGEAATDGLYGGNGFDTCDGGPAADFADVTCELPSNI